MSNCLLVGRGVAQKRSAAGRWWSFVLVEGMDPDGELFVCFLLTIVCNRLLVPEAPAANHLGPVLHRTETAQAGSPSIWFTFSFSLSPQHHHLHSYTNTDNHILRLNSLLEQTLLWNFCIFSHFCHFL